MIEISEIFHSLQGEGPFMGRPAAFVRLSRCVPPFCPWCDTAHARDPGTFISVDQILDKILSSQNDFVVITGGEPFLQWETGLKNLEKALVGKGFAVQYETSGKVEIPEDSEGMKVCSPKFVEGEWRFAPGNCELADAFKFVADYGFENIDAFVRRHEIRKEKVWIMPLGATRAEQLERFSASWKYCMENHYNFSPRLHILGFDNQKGI